MAARRKHCKVPGEYIVIDKGAAPLPLSVDGNPFTQRADAPGILICMHACGRVKWF
jgi:hypothetical protein